MATKRPTRTPAPFPEAAPADSGMIGEWPAVTRELHVGGVRVSDLPAQLQVAIVYAQTDEGIAERQAESAGKPRAMVEVVSDQFDKKTAAYGAQPWDAGVTDPITQLVDKIREPGFSYKALSPRVIDRRGDRGFEIVPGAKFGNMPIGRMPISEKDRRNMHYRQEGLERQEEAQEIYRATQEKLARDGGVAGFGPLPTGDVLTDVRDPERAASIGHTLTRG